MKHLTTLLASLALSTGFSGWVIAVWGLSTFDESPVLVITGGVTMAISVIFALSSIALSLISDRKVD